MLFQAVTTPEEERGYEVAVPDPPGCLSYGNARKRVAFEIVDAKRGGIGEPLRRRRGVITGIVGSG